MLEQQLGPLEGQKCSRDFQSHMPICCDKIAATGLFLGREMFTQSRAFGYMRTKLDHLVGIMIIPMIILISSLIEKSELGSSDFLPIVMIGLGIAVLALVLFRNRYVDPIERRNTLMIVLPLAVGFGLVGVTDDEVYLEGGVVLSIVMWLWVSRLRFPISYHLAAKYMLNGDLERALQSATKVIEVRPKMWEGHLLHSTVNLRLGCLVDAERDVRIAIQSAPNSALNYTILGHILLRQGRLEEARQSYEKAIQLAPGYAHYYYNLGLACYKLGKPNETIGALSKAKQGMQVDYANLLLYYYLGSSYETLGQRKRAIKAYRKMKKFREGLAQLEEELESWEPPDTALSFWGDLQNIERRLTSRRKSPLS